MDNRKIKRPRSTSPTTQDESPVKKKNKLHKKSKKPKINKSNTASEPHTPAPILKKPSTPSTATADGQMMAQMLSTFTKMEQSRFEAFQRSSMPQNTIQDWLIACLYHRNGPSYDGENKAIRIKTPARTMRLEDLVAPGQASDIGMVVATVAKIYAQRLVATAKQLQKRKFVPGLDDTDNDNNETINGKLTSENGSNEDAPKQSFSKTSNYSIDDIENKALDPQDIWRAWQYRCRQGLDPGFFLSSASSNSIFGGNYGGWNIPVHPANISMANELDDFSQRRLAALAAQDEYNKRSALLEIQNENDQGKIHTEERQNENPVAEESNCKQEQVNIVENEVNDMDFDVDIDD